MIPAAFEYFRAQSTDEALGHLQKYGSDARVLAVGAISSIGAADAGKHAPPPAVKAARIVHK